VPIPARNHNTRFSQPATRALCAALLLAVFFTGLSTPAQAAEPGSLGRNCAIGYRVRPGDTLASIARRFGVPLRLLAAANELSPGDPLTPGMLLCIPPYRVWVKLQYLYSTLSATIQFFGKGFKSRVILSGANYPIDHRYIVKARLHPGSAWSKIGSLRPDKYGKVYGNFKLPYKGKRIRSVYVCLKETTYGYTVCARVKFK
jgi:hypothetical protein